MHYFLLGPSGVGKTRFGNWLEANRQYFHLAVDRGDPPNNGLKAEGLWDLWGVLLQGNPAPFARALQERAKTEGKKGCVLTFYSVDVFAPDEIDRLAKHDIAVWYLYGPKEFCIEAYVSRENHPDKDRAFWCQNNRTYQRMGGPGLSSYRADIIEPSGKRLTEEEIAELLKIV
jgi:hypothetical protein